MSSSSVFIDDEKEDTHREGVMMTVCGKSLRELLHSNEIATKKLRTEEEKFKSLKRKVEVADKAAEESSRALRLKIEALERRVESLENVGASRLWDAVVKNDDICFKHILPKLNRSDVKFLYGVNSETRALIKRSSRRDDLRKSFEVSEMSSTSTLELAWENRSLWPFSKRHFCWQVAQTNKLELLKWVREVKNCDWNEMTINTVAYKGNLDMIKYCVANGCPFFSDVCAGAALKGRLECLKYLHEEAKAPWDYDTAMFAACRGHLHILEYLVEQKYDAYRKSACSVAAAAGNLDCLKFLHETAKAPWDCRAVEVAHENNRSECLQYLLDNDCPLPDGWRYEDGTLHTH